MHDELARMARNPRTDATAGGRNGESGRAVVAGRSKVKNAKIAAIGVLYTLRRDAEGKLDGPVNKRVYATFESYRALFEWIAQEAKKRGYGTTKFTKVLFVADGAGDLELAGFFPDAEVCLDWYHVVEALGPPAGNAVAVRAVTAQRSRAWVAAQKKRLRLGNVDKRSSPRLLRALSARPRRGPATSSRREVLGAVHGHFVKNAARMQYARLRRADLEISSGVVEGAVRHLVGVRLDGPGMRWGRDRASDPPPPLRAHRRPLG